MAGLGLAMSGPKDEPDFSWLMNLIAEEMLESSGSIGAEDRPGWEREPIFTADFFAGREGMP